MERGNHTEGQILEVWRETEMQLRRLAVCNEDLDKQPEERAVNKKQEMRKKQGERQM